MMKARLQKLLPWLHLGLIAWVMWLAFNHIWHLKALYGMFWELPAFVGFGVIGSWRWSLLLLRWVRGQFYLRWTFRRWRKRARQVPLEALPPVCLVVPTYKEKDWITERVFRAIAREAQLLPQGLTVLANSSSNAENQRIREILEETDPQLQSINLILMVQKDGKRKAMADGLEVLSEEGFPKHGVIALMDGDSELTPATLLRCLPFFTLFPKMGALTTDELPVVKGSSFFSEWFHMRFAQRHYQMCSDSLDRKVMCLTGRFSLFRAEAALDPGFAEQLCNDQLDDWLWGRFKFLSGDDKSTWFWLLRQGYDMLYIPDVLVYSIETLSGSVVERSYQNMRRWFGNMLRNNGRALALGPRKTGGFLWYSLLDQRLSMWTSLLSPSFLLIAALQGHWVSFQLIGSWIILSRLAMLLAIFAGRPSHLKLLHLPILLLTQWLGSLVKIWTQMNLVKQKWTNRGNQSIDAGGAAWKLGLKVNLSRFLLWTQVASFIIGVLWLNGVMNPIADLQGWQLESQYQASSQGITRVQAIDYGVVPHDGLDDAAALQSLINQSQAKHLEVRLPIGELEFRQPLEIRRGDVTVKGQGKGRTVVLVPQTVVSQQQASRVTLAGLNSDAVAQSDAFDQVIPDSIVTAVPQLLSPPSDQENLVFKDFSLRLMPMPADDLTQVLDPKSAALLEQ